MDTVVYAKAQPAVRKVKKKQAKGEVDRLKQAEKKTRRLEKALATSAAIRSELELKKQRKKEEQQRLDEEGAAIAEAVALHVLLSEDSDDSCQILMNEGQRLHQWNYSSNLVMDTPLLCVPYDNCLNYPFKGIGLVSSQSSQFNWGQLETNGFSVSTGSRTKEMQTPYFDGEIWGSAAEALSSLQITDDTSVDAIVFNGILRE